jgi:hypothetical protein
MADVNRDTTDGAQEWAQHRFVIELLINDVTNRSRACELEDEGVDPGDVIRQEEEAAFRQMLKSERANAIENFDERPPKKMERALTGGHVRHRLLRLLFTISVRPFICQSTIGHAGSPQTSIHERNCGALAAPCH